MFYHFLGCPIDGWFHSYGENEQCPVRDGEFLASHDASMDWQVIANPNREETRKAREDKEWLQRISIPPEQQRVIALVRLRV